MVRAMNNRVMTAQPLRGKNMRRSVSRLLSLVFVVLGIGSAAAQPPPPPTPPAPYIIPASTPANIRRAVESPERTDEMRIRDYYRKPAEILRLATGVS